MSAYLVHALRRWGCDLERRAAPIRFQDGLTRAAYIQLLYPIMTDTPQMQCIGRRGQSLTANSSRTSGKLLPPAQPSIVTSWRVPSSQVWGPEFHGTGNDVLSREGLDEEEAIAAISDESPGLLLCRLFGVLCYMRAYQLLRQRLLRARRMSLGTELIISSRGLDKFILYSIRARTRQPASWQTMLWHEAMCA